MMDREELLQEVLASDSNKLMLELATSVGKSRLAIEKIKQWELQEKIQNILIVVPRLVLIDNWKKELEKWNANSLLPKITFSTYVGLSKIEKEYSCVLFDEGHHLTERCFKLLEGCKIHKWIALSATISKELKQAYKWELGNFQLIRVNVREAISVDILPEPKIYLVPLELKDVEGTFYYEKKVYGRMTKTPYTAVEYHKALNADINYWATKAQYGDERSRNIWLSLCNKRLKWLSSLKTTFFKEERQRIMRGRRTITFCCDTKQADKIATYDITSKKKKALINLQKFNDGEINHISAVNMLNEGSNLYNCQVGIFLYIAASDTINVQQLGRVLRHSEPIAVFPFFRNTREEEIVQKHLSKFNNVEVISFKKQ